MLFCLLGMLSKDCPRKELFAYFRENIHKGELVQLAKSDQWMVAYSNPPVFIDCQKDQLKFVKPMFVQYLLAVENLSSRFNLFINNLNSLTRNMLLDVGDKVDVIMDQYTIPPTAVIKYKGNLPGKSGIVFGIKILVSHSACTQVKYLNLVYTYIYIHSYVFGNKLMFYHLKIRDCVN